MSMTKNALLAVLSAAATGLASEMEDPHHYRIDMEPVHHHYDHEFDHQLTNWNHDAEVGSDLDSKKNNAEKARALVSQISWGVVSHLDDGNQPQGEVLSFADSKGHVFFYLMGKHDQDKLSLTLTQASLPPYSNLEQAACGKDGKFDAEDPRCAKISISGHVEPCDKEKDELCQAGWSALLERHPSMAQWPKDHDFIVHQFQISDIWMIANFGGQTIIDPNTYYQASPTADPVDVAEAEQEEASEDRASKDNYPPWDKKAERARWIVARALWTTISSVSVRLKGDAWGNIRSVVDGKSTVDSSGLPVFYIPTPDATAIDIKHNPKIALTLSEASLADRLEGNKVCGGMDAENPLCARVTLMGTAKEIKGTKLLKDVQAAFGKRHPLAPWLAHGGAHTGGAYYTIDLEKIMILDFFGGATEVNVEDYMADGKREEKEDEDMAKSMLRGLQQ